MNIEAFLSSEANYPWIQILLTVSAYVLYRIVKRLFQKIATKRALLQNFDETRAIYVKKAMGYAIFLGFLVLIGIIWEVSLQGLSVYIASFLTIVGIGFFAVWSILSNITAAIILFFFFPIKIGSKVKINDGENSADGTITALSLFSITITREDGTVVFYPNNQAIQKSISHYKS